MSEQQKQLDNLRKWLTLTEDRISRLSDKIGPDINSLRSQLDALKDLQTDLQKQQKNVDLLSNLVVIVDEGTNENGINLYASMFGHFQLYYFYLQIIRVYFFLFFISLM